IYPDGASWNFLILEGLTSTFNQHLNCSKTQNLITSCHARSNRLAIATKIAALGIGESKKILNYQIIGGNNPQIYLRMNSIYPLETAIKKGDFYQNSILKDVQTKHYTSVEMLKYLFTKEQEGKTQKERIL